MSRRVKDKTAMYAGREGWQVKWMMVLLGLLVVIGLSFLARQVAWGGHLLAWLNLIMRWFHVVVAIAWIGSSFYFIWLENHLERENAPEDLAGSLYSVHGGGFYYVQKYKTAPPRMPETLHWFQWEAYLTWVSGFALLIIVYYANAQTMMVNVGGITLPAYLTILIGLATLALGWLIYDRLCRSPLVRNMPLFVLIALILVTLLALVLSLLLSGRAAYMHVGAMLGTLMAANVFFVIIPAHRAMVKAVQEGQQVDPAVGKHASLRSLHNNYMTLPVIFVMISNHYPTTFGNTYNWAVLAGLFLASAAIRHYLNLQERGREARWILPAASLAVLALALVTAPQMQRFTTPAPAIAGTQAMPVSFEDAQEIITARCVMCHAGAQAPKGIRLDTPEEIMAHVQDIHRTAVETDYMPLGNATGMTDEERAILGRWIAASAGRD